MLGQAIILEVPAIIKARKDGDRRLVEVEASSEAVDSEGDVILQSALMNSADSFLKSGNLDIDHYSEIGERIGIPNPMAFIVGRPIEVKDLGEGRTSVVGEIRRAAEHDPRANKYDAFWDSLNSTPPVIWRASIYGFPTSGGVEDCRSKVCDKGATRFLVKGIDWRSLAFTRNPINQSLTGVAKIVTAKARIDVLRKNGSEDVFPQEVVDLANTPSHGVAGPVVASDASPATVTSPPYMQMPYNMDELVGQYHNHIKTCLFTAGMDSIVTFRDHFMNCCQTSRSNAEMAAAALMYHVLANYKD